MGKLKKLVLVTAVIILALSYLLYAPIPPGYEKPWQVQFFFSLVKFNRNVCPLLAKLGFGSSNYLNGKILEAEASLMEKLYPTPGISWKETSLDGVRALIFTPDGVTSGSSVPGVVYMHGGGWVYGSPEGHLNLPAFMSGELNAVVVSLDYRRAPEHVFPAAFDDCLKATKYFMSNAKDYGVDPSRIAVAGDSAGGQLSASISLALRDEKVKPPLKLQVLIYPVTQGFNMETPSYQLNRNDFLLPITRMSFFFASYVLGSDENMGKVMNNTHVSSQAKRHFYQLYTNPDTLPKGVVHSGYTPPDLAKEDVSLAKQMSAGIFSYKLSPLLAEDLSNLPMAYIYVGEYDTLRDDALWYYQRLEEAGTKAVLDYDKLGYHGKMFLNFKISDEAMLYVNKMLNFMRDNL